MAIDRAPGETKHIITEHNHLVGNRLRVFTYCGWVFIDSRTEGAYVYGEWWAKGTVPDVCPHYLHKAVCEVNDASACEGCTSVKTKNHSPSPPHRGGLTWPNTR